MRRLLPDPGPTSVGEQLDELELVTEAHDDRPYVITNFAITLDGRATIQGRSGPIGSDTDTQMLVGLRTKVDAVMIGAGTLRAERYGRIVPDPEKRARRERDGLPHDPLAVVVSGRLDIPWDAPLFTEGGGPGADLHRVRDGAARYPDPGRRRPPPGSRRPGRGPDPPAHRARRPRPALRGRAPAARPADRGGPGRRAFVTHAPKLAGGEGPGLATGLPELERPLELAWLLEQDGELFARYRTVS